MSSFVHCLIATESLLTVTAFVDDVKAVVNGFCKYIFFILLYVFNSLIIFFGRVTKLVTGYGTCLARKLSTLWTT